MSGIYPDSGVVASNAVNSVNVESTNCTEELFHSTARCTPRFDPAAANAVMSEILNMIAAAGLAYNCGDLSNLARVFALAGGAKPASVGQLIPQGGFVECGDGVLYWNNTDSAVTLGTEVSCAALEELGLVPVVDINYATSDAAGIVEFSTNEEFAAGTDCTKVPTLCQVVDAIAAATAGLSGADGNLSGLTFDTVSNTLTATSTVGGPHLVSLASLGGGGSGVADGVIISGAYDSDDDVLKLNSSLGAEVQINFPDGLAASIGGAINTPAGGLNIAGALVIAPLDQTQTYTVPASGVSHVWVRAAFNGGTVNTNGCAEGLFAVNAGETWTLNANSVNSLGQNNSNGGQVVLADAGSSSVGGNDTTTAFAPPSGNTSCSGRNVYLVPMN